jgi:hypothetical protein
MTAGLSTSSHHSWKLVGVVDSGVRGFGVVEAAVLGSPHVDEALGHRVRHSSVEHPLFKRPAVSADTAARTVMAAVTGAALSLISQPDLFGDDTFATQLREAVIASITVSKDAVSTSKQRAHEVEPTIATAAATLGSKLAAEDTPLTEPERALMQQWLATLADASTTALPAPPRPPQRRGKESSRGPRHRHPS